MGHYREPVKNTCPDVDKGLRIIETITKEVNDRKKDPSITEYESDALYIIESYLSDLPDILEGLRESNSKLRDWGAEEAENFDAAEQEIERLNNELETWKIK